MSQHLQRAKFAFKSVAIIGIALIAVFLAFAAPARAQQHALTSDDYARAEKFMPYNTAPLVLHSGVRPNWLPDDRFTYRITTSEGSEFLIVDPAKATREPAFDHAKLAAALSAAAGATYDAHHLPFMDFELSADGHSVSFTAQGGTRYKCDLPATQCTADTAGGGRRGGGGGGRGGRGGAGGGRGNQSISPDGKLAAYIQDYNLYVRPVAGGDPNCAAPDRRVCSVQTD